MSEGIGIAFTGKDETWLRSLTIQGFTDKGVGEKGCSAQVWTRTCLVRTYSLLYLDLSCLCLGHWPC